MPLFPWEGLAFEINRFQVVPALWQFMTFMTQSILPAIMLLYNTGNVLHIFV